MAILLYCLNLYFGATLGISGLTKVADSEYFASTLHRQHLIPAILIPLISKTFQWLELAIALLLVIGIDSLAVAINLIILLLFIGFLGVKLKLVGTAKNECGCYGKSLKSNVDVSSITVSIILVVLASLQFWLSFSTTPINIEFRVAGFILYCCVGAWLLSRIVKAQLGFKSSKHNT